MNVFELFATLSLDSSNYEQSLNEAESKGSKFGSGLKKAGKVVGGALVAASAASLKFGKDSVQAGMQFDSSMSQVAATMGLTTDEIGDLRDYAQKMGSETVFSATQSADALNYMALAGYDSETAMAMLPNVLNLAAAGGIELASASDMVTDAQSALGLSLEDTAVMVDQMAKASSKSNTSVAQLGEAFLTVGGTAKNLQGGTNELATALGILADNGIKGAEGGTTLRNMILSLTAPTQKSAQLMENLGLQAFDAEGNMRPLNDVFSDLNGILSQMNGQEKAETLSAIFNKVDLKGANALLANTTNSFDAISQGLDQAGVDWSKYSDAVWAADGVQKGLFSDLMNNMRDFSGSAQDLADLKEYFEFEYSIDGEDAQKMIDSISAAVGQQSSRWEELSGEIDDAQGSAQKMADTQLDNLSGDITLFKSALEGAQIAISDSLTPSLRDFVQLGSKGLSAVTQGFKEGGLKGAMGEFGTWLSELVAKVIEALPSLLEAGMSLIEALLKGVIDNLPLLLDTALTLVLTLATGIGEAAPQLIPSIVDVILVIIDKLTQPDTLSLLINAAFILIGGIATGIIKATPSIVKTIPTLVKNLVTSLVQNFPLLISSFLGLLADLFQSGLEAINDFMGVSWDDIGKGLENIKKGITAAFDAIKGFFTDLWNNTKQIVKDMWDGIKNFFGDGLDGAKEKVTSGLDAIVGFFTDKFDRAKEIVKNAIEAIKNFFKFDWKLPDLKLPHFKLQGEFSLNPPSVPKIGVDWYKKAYGDAYLLNGATIFGAQGGKLLGGGEGNGTEAVVGTNLLRKLIREESGSGLPSQMVFPIYIGNDKIDEKVITAQQIYDFISGGRG